MLCRTENWNRLCPVEDSDIDKSEEENLGEPEEDDDLGLRNINTRVGTILYDFASQTIILYLLLGSRRIDPSLRNWDHQRVFDIAQEAGHDLIMEKIAILQLNRMGLRQ
jgi:hypothetical protein